MVDVLKTEYTQPPWNLHMERIQVVVEWEVHITPPCAIWNGMELLEFTQWNDRGSLATYV
jgi:hypothetical protein